MVADHFGGFVFVAAAVVAQTQHTDRDSGRDKEPEWKMGRRGGSTG